MFDFKSFILIFVCLIILFALSQLIVSIRVVGATRKLIENKSNDNVKKYINLLKNLLRLPKFPIIVETIKAGYDSVAKDKKIDRNLKSELKSVLVKRKIID